MNLFGVFEENISNIDIVFIREIPFVCNEAHSKPIELSR